MNIYKVQIEESSYIYYVVAKNIEELQRKLINVVIINQTSVTITSVEKLNTAGSIVVL